MSSKKKVQVAEQTITAPSKLENEVTTDNNPAESTVDIRKGFLKGIRLAVVTVSLCLGTFLVALDVNIIGVAVPRIATAFKSLDDVAWYGSGYLLTVTAFQPTMGVIYKYFDVRVTYIVVILIFEVGSTVCAAAPDSKAFIVGRAVAGLGAAGILQGALAIIGYIVELERRPMFMGIVISVFGISICIGPVMGGAITDHVSWRCNLPIGGAALALILIFLRLSNAHNEDRSLSLKEKFHHMDYVGTITFIGSICCLILALQWGGQTMPWSSAKVIALFVTSGVLAILFAYIQWKLGDRATIPLRILRQRSILSGSTFLFFFGMLNYVYSFYLPFYFQAVRGSSATSSGIRMIPLVLPQILAIMLVGAIVTKFGVYVPYIIVGQIICVIGAGVITRIDLGTSTALWATYFVIAGLGMGMGMQIPYTALQVVLSERDAPTGNAIAVFSNQLGGVIAIPACQALLLNTLRTELPRKTLAVTPDIVINTGPANLQLLAAGNDALLRILRQTYAAGLRRTYIFALAAGCVAVVCALGMEWKNLKVEAEAREKAAANGGEKDGSGVAGEGVGRWAGEGSLELRSHS
ncbi:MAG: hypothetical protein LQ349_005153 [Xanthoria aureola]|nr:MAG: hypothetical protein LQ349_005153 [Xanthoria aureola]